MTVVDDAQALLRSGVGVAEVMSRTGLPRAQVDQVVADLKARQESPLGRLRRLAVAVHNLDQVGLPPAAVRAVGRAAERLDAAVAAVEADAGEGITVAPKGRIPARVVAAYDRAHGGGS